MAAPDRLQMLLQQNAVTGIDFVFVHDDQTTLDVFFFRHAADPQAAGIVGAVSGDQVLIAIAGGDASSAEGPAVMPVLGAQWLTVDNRSVLRLKTPAPGGFALYKLRLDRPTIDRYFNDVTFSFKAACASDLDCEPAEPACPPEEWVDFPVDYQARDFDGFRRALLDFASQRYPDWQDRLEADVGVMLVEVMSALADELSYLQGRIHREAYLETASQRRSLRHHARLVDYEMHNGLTAAGWLDVTCRPGQSGNLPAGADVWALSDRGKRLAFEVGRGLHDVLAGRTFAVSATRNSLAPHIWDEDDFCLPVGAAALYIKGHQKANLTFDDPPEDPTGKWVLLKTTPANPATPERRWLVRVVAVEETRDLVFGEDISLIRWEEAQALPFELNLTELAVRANLAPVTGGRTVANRFVVGVEPVALGLPDAATADLRRAVERVGGQDDIAYRFSLTRPALRPEDAGKVEAQQYLDALAEPAGRELCWLGRAAPNARPEIHLAEVAFDGVNWVEQAPAWQWRRALVGVSSSQAQDRHFTLEDGTWDRVVGYWRSGQEIVHQDYASDDGFTIRFGDGEFGLIPPRGAIFQATYRLGNGRAGNVPADTITHFSPGLAFVESVTNPLPAENGQDPESAADVRKLAPEAFRYLTYRAVRPEDYAEAVERLDWVQRAGAGFRWTGSWLTLFAAPDPVGAVAVSDVQREAAQHQLDRFRQAGREAYVASPRYADLDLEITVCAARSAYASEVKEALLAVLLGQQGARPVTGFFSPDNFTFGTPLRRAALEAVIQATAGVRAVEAIQIRRRGHFDWRPFSELSFPVAPDEVIRLESDPRHPARGSLRLTMKGGA